ncbi:unnamed protein product [marine sediment metagenome]|uniref:Uncharacterized protein n=1 Tax=marine sediment metagenome TaxID=412755 RepID=X0SHG6_9ZZZZ
MSSEKKVYTGLSQDESDKMQKYLREISRIYGIRLAEIGDFLGKKLKNHRKGEHQWFMAFMIIDEIFDEMVAKLLTFIQDAGQREIFESIIREAQALVKEELPLPKQD